MNEEAIKILKDILKEATETDDSISYVTSGDANALKAAIQALEQMESSSEKPNKSEIPTSWIPVSERLPENLQRVLVTIVNYNDDKVVRVAEYRDNKRMFQIKENHEQWEVGEEGLLAWMPLPEPYNAESEDKE